MGRGDESRSSVDYRRVSVPSLPRIDENRTDENAASRSQKAIYIQEPCSHPVVFSGLCAVCGKDLESM